MNNKKNDKNHHKSTAEDANSNNKTSPQRSNKGTPTSKKMDNKPQNSSGTRTIQ